MKGRQAPGPGIMSRRPLVSLGSGEERLFQKRTYALVQGKGRTLADPLETPTRAGLQGLGATPGEGVEEHT